MSTPSPRSSFSRAIVRVHRLERLIAAFTALPDDDRQILSVLSLVPQAVTRTELTKLCQAFRLLVAGKTINATNLGERVASWHSSGLVAWDGTRCELDVDLSLFLVRLVAETPFGEQLRVAETSRVITAFPGYDSLPRRIGHSRFLRWKRHPTEAGEILGNQVLAVGDVPHPAYWFGPGDPSFAIEHIPNGDKWLAQAIRFDVRYLRDCAWEFCAASHLCDSIDTPSEDLWLKLDRPHLARYRAQFLARRFADNQDFKDATYLELLLTGKHKAMRARAESEVARGHSVAAAYVGAALLVEGRLDDSLTHFAAAMAAGANAKSVAAFQGTWLGILHLVALLARKSPSDVSVAEFIFRRAIGKGTKRELCECPTGMRRLADYWTRSTLGSLGALRDEPVDDFDVGDILGLLLGLSWAHSPNRAYSSLGHVFSGFRARSAELGHTWFVDELNAVLLHPSGEVSNPVVANDVKPSTALVHLVRVKEPWEIALESLELAANPVEKSVKAGEAPRTNTRLAWFVTVRGAWLALEPRLQTLKGSVFSKGRSVALSRLIDGDGRDLPILPEDLRVAKHLRRSPSYYGSTEYHWEDTVCLGLVGHPFVFDAHDESVHYEVKEGTVILRCEPHGVNGHALRLDPPVDPSLMSSTGVPGKAFVQRKGTELWVYKLGPELLRVASLVGKGVTIPESGENRLRELLPRLSKLVPTTASISAADDAETKVGDTTPVLRIRPNGELLRLQLLVTPFGIGTSAQVPGSGAEVCAQYENGRAAHVRRNLEEERERATALWQKLASLGEVTSSFTWNAPDLLGCLSLLAELPKVYAGEARIEWPEGQPLRLKRQRSMTVDIKGGDATQWFDADGSVELDDGAALRVFELLGKLERRLGRFVALTNGDYAELTEAAMARLALLQSYSIKSETDGALRVAPWLALALPQSTEPSCMESGSPAWQNWRKRIASALERKAKLSKHFVGTLRDYQFEGFQWLCRMAALGTGVCLADDMGLGKTVQALALLQYRATRKAADGDEAGPMLIVAPASVCPGWLSEAARFTPNLEPRWLTGKERTLSDLTRKTLLVCTYDVLHRDIEALKKITFDTVILDEAHHIKNAHTRRARAAFSLNARFRLATTGTPIENHLGELWSLYHFLMPGLLGDQHQFVERFRSPIENARDDARREQLRALVQPFLLRRTKQQVLSELPEKTEIVRKIELSPPERELYEALRLRGLEALSEQSNDKNQQRVRVLAELMRLRRACCHPRLVLPESDLSSSKLQVLLELIDELREAGHRALLFSQFVDHLLLVREALDDLGVSYQYLDGGTKMADRAKAVEAFQGGDGELFLISLKAGGTGLNLTAADYVIHLDPWWNPAVEDQASDRAHRIGQSRPVTIYRLVTAGTIEEKLVAMHRDKRTLAADILADTESTRRLDPDELLNLLRDAALSE